jgi:catechol 2,3-dioxygenase-like lactoylglutathione lyase family enzyme
MTVQDTYPLFTVSLLTESRDFFVKHFGMQVLFEANWVVMLSLGEDRICLGLMTAEHPSRPPGPEVFTGEGAIFTVQTNDAAGLHARFAEQGALATYGPTVEPWGQRRFMVQDPSGLLVDVVEQIEPAAGWWDQYVGSSTGR